MPLLTLATPHIRVVIDPQHGAELVRLENAAGINMLFAAAWKSPLPANVSRSYGDSVLDWHSEYRGGWQELFPNAGDACVVMGTPLPFHGELSRANWEWSWLEQDTAVVLRCAARLPLVLERTMRVHAERAVLVIDERIVNESPLTVPYIWGHHPAFGPPLAEAGARIDLPATNLIVDAGMDGAAVDLQPGSVHTWPLTRDRHDRPIDLSVIPAAPIQRFGFLTDVAEGWYAVRNPARRLGVGLAWDRTIFPHLWFWQEIGGGEELPWYGRAAITALEPMTQWPAHGLAAAVAAGQARLLTPGQEVATSLTCVLFDADERAVTQVTADGIVHSK